MNNVISFSDNQQHLVVPLIDDNVVVVPIRYIEDIIEGNQKPVVTKDNKLLILSIIKEWYENVKVN